MSVRSEELYRLLYNAHLFQRPKVMAGDAVRIQLTQEELALTVTDDHVILLEKTDDIEFSGTKRNYTFWFNKKAVKEMLTVLADEGYPEWVETVSFFQDFDQSTDSNSDIFKLIDLMRKEHGYVGKEHTLWALNRDRLRLLGLLKTPGPTVYPIDFNSTYSATLERQVVQFKVGPTIRGFVAPLLRGGLKDSEVADGLFD